MASGITLNIGANTREAVRGAKDVSEELEKVSDSLDDVARDGSKSGDKLESAFDSSRKEAAKVERSFKDLADTAKKETSAAGDAVGRNVKAGTDKAEEGLTDLKQEAGSTAKEAAASFGGIEDAGSALQEALANVFVGFGPAGAAAGIAAAIGVGIIFSKMEEGKEQTAEFKEAVGELTAELIATGDKGGPSLEYIVDKLKELATASGEGETSLADLRDVSDKAGSSFEDLAKAYAGNADELDKLVKKNQDYYAELEAQADLPDLTPAQTKAIQDKIVAQEKYNSYLYDARDKADAAAEAEANYVAAGGPAMEAKAAAIELINDAYDDAAGAADDFKNKESGLLDTDAYIASMVARQTALDEYQNTLATSALTPEAKAFLNSQGAEAASTFAAGYKAGSPAQQAELNRIWSEAGKQNSGTYSTALTAGIPKTIAGPTVVLGQPDTGALVREAQRQITGYGVLKMEVQAFMKPGKFTP